MGRCGCGVVVQCFRGEVFTIVLTRDSIRENRVAEFEEGCRAGGMPAEPGRGRPGTCGDGNTSRPDNSPKL